MTESVQGNSRWLNFMEMGCTVNFKAKADKQLELESRETDMTQFYQFIDKTGI